jgi:hypothetical protein
MRAAATELATTNNHELPTHLSFRYKYVLIGYGGARSLLGRGREGGDRLLSLHRRVTMLDRNSNSSSVALRV